MHWKEGGGVTDCCSRISTGAATRKIKNGQKAVSGESETKTKDNKQQWVLIASGRVIVGFTLCKQ